MNLIDIKTHWKFALAEVLDSQLEESYLNALSFQTRDSIRRIEVYASYRKRGEDADRKRLPYHFSTNPLVLSQRPSISNLSKIWYLYLATYFGKSHISKWSLFKRAAFNGSKVIFVEDIINDRDQYFEFLLSDNFFEGCQFSNHRKYTKKCLTGRKGFINSCDYFLDNINKFNFSHTTPFDTAYKLFLKTPSIGRLSAFDYVCSLCKCNLNVCEPASMYLQNSSGPKTGIKYLLHTCGLPSPTNNDVIQAGNELQIWFTKNTNLFLVAQVLEDAICNWQKNPSIQRRYFG